MLSAAAENADAGPSDFAMWTDKISMYLVTYSRMTFSFPSSTSVFRCNVLHYTSLQMAGCLKAAYSEALVFIFFLPELPNISYRKLTGKLNLL